MDKFNNLIIHLMAIEGYAKDIHYNIADYSIHLFADRVQDDLSDFIDEIKENCILAKGKDVLKSSEYLLNASKLIPNNISLNELKNLLVDVLVVLEQINELSLGDGDLLGRIGSKIQNNLGVLNIILKDNK